MLNILIPMAGAGSRFSAVGFHEPKPLIKIHGVPMIKLVIDNLRPSCPHRFIFICQRAHVANYGLLEQLSRWAPGCSVILLDGLTEGAACTVLKAKHLIDNTSPLMIANCDQYVDLNIDDYLAQFNDPQLDGLIMTMFADDPKWSFVGLDSDNYVNRVVEKEVISNSATVGIYNFRKGRDFVAGAEEMIAREIRVKGEFYVAPAYNQLIDRGYRVGTYSIGLDGAGMHGLGTPTDLERFLALQHSQLSSWQRVSAC